MMKAIMRIFAPLAVCVLLSTGIAKAHETPEAEVVPVLKKALADYPGKEITMITVEYPPGSVDPVHRHNAHSFIYVLEGSIVMGVRGGKTVTLEKGDTFYEGPEDVHTVGRNASQTQSAKFLVVMLKNEGSPIVLPAH